MMIGADLTPRLVEYVSRFTRVRDSVGCQERQRPTSSMWPRDGLVRDWSLEHLATRRADVRKRKLDLNKFKVFFLKKHSKIYNSF